MGEWKNGFAGDMGEGWEGWGAFCLNCRQCWHPGMGGLHLPTQTWVGSGSVASMLGLLDSRILLTRMAHSVPGKNSQCAASLLRGPTTALLQAAPEMLLGARCTEKADIYSFGRSHGGFCRLAIMPLVDALLLVDAANPCLPCCCAAYCCLAPCHAKPTALPTACLPAVPCLPAGVVLWEICTAQTPVRGQLRDVK
jgi:hypothetical protein